VDDNVANSVSNNVMTSDSGAVNEFINTNDESNKFVELILFCFVELIVVILLVNASI
jgi:hypothetical protein